MFGKQDASMAHTHAGSETIIAQGVKLEGEFRSNGDVVIDGELNGLLETASSLHVGETAVIHAEVKAKNAVIAGVIVGNIQTDDGLQLLSTSNITGDIITGRLSVAEGAIINGHVSMGARG